MAEQGAHLPVLWTFRRCPFAMRARLALAVAGIEVEHREILLRDKPAAFLRASPKGTVPVLCVESEVIEESLDIMIWALNCNDPEGWLEMPGFGYDLITECDGPFKTALDRYKYHSRYEDADIEVERHRAGEFLHKLDRMLAGRRFLFGDSPRLADMAIVTFVRQFANTDRGWFDAQPWPGLADWLERFVRSDRFIAIMDKRPVWQPDAELRPD